MGSWGRLAPAAALAVAVAAGPGAAQVREPTGYRPLLVEEAEPAPPGVVEVEPEVAFADEADGARRLAATVRVAAGWTDRIDLRLAAGYLAVDPEGGGREGGPGDTEVGARILFREGGRAPGPSLALQTTLKLPTADADRGLGTGSLDVRLLGVASWRLRGGGRLDLNVGYTVVGRETLEGAPLRDPRFYGAAAGAPVGRGRLLAEVFVAESPFERRKSEANTALGLAWPLREGLEVGGALRRRLRSGAGPDWEVVAGAELVWR
jgi:hypothetical protein